MNHQATQENLDAWGFTRKPRAQQAPEDLDKRFREVTDAIDEKLNRFQDSMELMVEMMNKRLDGFEARLPQAAVKSRKHDTPLFALPP